MLRRSLLTAAIAAPAIITTRKASAQCWPILQGPGSSVMPFGTPPADDGASIQIDPCGSGGGPFSPAQWPVAQAMVNFEYLYNMGIGNLAVPEPRLITGLDDMYLAQQLSPEIRAEIGHLANFMAVGGGVGGLIGTAIRGWSVGGPMGAMIGVGGGSVVYFVDQTLVIVREISEAGIYVPSVPLNLDGRQGFLNAWGMGGYGQIGGFRMYNQAVGQPAGGERWIVHPNKLN